MQKCLDASNVLVKGAQTTWTTVLTSTLTVDSVFTIIATALDPFYHLADINFSCFVGAQEAYGQIQKYGAFITDYTLLLRNFLFNFGRMYDAIKDVVTFFINEDRSNARTPADLGAQMGAILFNVFANFIDSSK